MATDLLPEVDLDALIDLSASVPCMWPQKCETPAAWKMTNLCTVRHGYTLCTMHKNLEQAHDAMMALMFDRTCHCQTCNQELSPPFCEWSEL